MDIDRSMRTTTAYLVRLDGKLLGIFVAETIRELFYVVDHHVDPGSCEYAILPSSGGITVYGPKLPIRDHEPTDDEIYSAPELSLQHAVIHDDWRDSILYGYRLEWKTIDELSKTKLKRQRR